MLPRTRERSRLVPWRTHGQKTFAAAIAVDRHRLQVKGWRARPTTRLAMTLWHVIGETGPSIRDDRSHSGSSFETKDVSCDQLCREHGLAAIWIFAPKRRRSMTGGLPSSPPLRSDRAFRGPDVADGTTSPRLGRGHAGDHGKIVGRMCATFFPVSYRHL